MTKKMMKKPSPPRKPRRPDDEPPPGEEMPPPPPEETAAPRRAALVLHCGGRAFSTFKGGAVVFGSRNIITDHADLAYVRLTQSFRFGHDEITYLSPYFDRGPVRRDDMRQPLLNRRGAIARFDRRKVRDRDIELVEGVVVLDGPNTLASVRAFFDRVAAMRHDEVFVYVHGHGNAAETFARDGTIVLADENDATSELISFPQLATWILAIQADHAGVAVDTCYCGQLARPIREANRRHLLVAMSTDERDPSFGDDGHGYHKIREGTFGDWSDLFLFSFKRRNVREKVDQATARAARAARGESLNATPLQAPPELLGH